MKHLVRFFALIFCGWIASAGAAWVVTWCWGTPESWGRASMQAEQDRAVEAQRQGIRSAMEEARNR